MKNLRIWFFVSLTVLTISAVLLVTSSPLLTVGLDKNDTIPLGTFITWAGLISLPLSIYLGISELRNPTGSLNKILSGMLKICIAGAILWVPVSYFLAGNISFTFAERETFRGGQTAMILFWRFTYGIGIGSILILLGYWISRLFKR